MDVSGRGYALTPHAPRGHSMPQTVYAERETMISRGDLFSASLDPVVGSEQGGIRPVLILQNNLGNIYCPTLIVAPLTTQTGKKPNQPPHYKLAGDGKAIRPSTVLLEQITTIDKRRVAKRLSRLGSSEMDRMKEHILMSLGIHIPEEVEAP